VLVLLLAALFFLYERWPKPQEPYWFVSYEWVKAKERGAGRTCLVMKDIDFDILSAENSVKNKNTFDSLIITDFIRINKATYDFCVKQ
jgi:hypothetical protein